MADIVPEAKLFEAHKPWRSFATREAQYTQPLQKNLWTATMVDKFIEANAGHKKIVYPFQFLYRSGSITLNLPREAEVDFTVESACQGIVGLSEKNDSMGPVSHRERLYNMMKADSS